MFQLRADVPPDLLKTIQNNIELLESGLTPDYWPDMERMGLLGGFEVFSLRETVNIKHNMWALVDKVWTKVLAERLQGQKCLEIMAGSGWLSKALSEHGISAVATDRDAGRAVFDVTAMDAAEAIKTYREECDVLILSWPTYSCPAASECLTEWPTDKPIVYIGESQGGCCAEDSFFSQIEFLEEISIPSWGAIHDRCYICKRVEVID